MIDDTKEVTLVVTVQVCSHDGSEPDKKQAQETAQEAVNTALYDANNSGYTHDNADTLGVNVVAVETMSDQEYLSFIGGAD